MQGTELRTLTTPEEKSRRFDLVNGEFMGKYLDLIWFARANPDDLLKKGESEIAAKVAKVAKEMQGIADKYPREVAELIEDDTNWRHGFNSGVLAYARFLATYVEDTLWELGDFNEDIAQHEKVITINGIDYIEFDGRQDAFDSFPELDT